MVEQRLFANMVEGNERNSIKDKRQSRDIPRHFSHDDRSEDDKDVIEEAKKDNDDAQSYSSAEDEPFWIDDLAGETMALTAALKDAAIQNNLRTLRTLLEFGAVTPHTVERGTGRTAIWYAACFGSLECLRILADWAYDVAYNDYVARYPAKHNDDSSQSNNPAAHSAAQETLLALLNQPTLWGSKPLLIAAARNHPSTVQLLLENYFVDVNSTNGSGSGHGNTTAALIAASEGHAEVLNILAKHGADLDLPNENGTTPIMIAAQNGRVDIMTFLYLYGVNLNKLDENGMNCVALAAYHNHPSVVEFLLSIAEVVDATAIVNFNQPSGPMEETPLGIAAMKGHVNVLKALLKSPRVNLTSTNSAGMNALFIATKLHQVEVAQLICRQTRDRLNPVVNQKDRTSGWTPLYCAVAMNYHDLVELLAPLSDMNVLCGLQGPGSILTPVLVAAAAKDDYGDCLTLLQAGAFVDVMDGAGHTALGVAAKNGFFKVCDLLCQYGANINHRSRKGGRTPLQKARKYKQARVVTLLERYQQQQQQTSTIHDSIQQFTAGAGNLLSGA